MAPHVVKVQVLVLWEEEIRAAARACTAAEVAIVEGDGKMTQAVADALTSALAQCSVALKGADDDSAHVLLTRFAPSVAEARKKVRSRIDKR